MRIQRANRRWPISLYWTLMLGVPAAGLLMMAGYVSAYYIAQWFLSR